MADFSGKEYWLYKEIEEELCKVEDQEVLYFRLGRYLNEGDQVIVESMLYSSLPLHRSPCKEVVATAMLDRIRKYPDWKKLLLEVCEDRWLNLKHVAELVRKMQIYEGVEKRPDVSKDTKDKRFEKIPDVSKDTKDERFEKIPDVSKDTKDEGVEKRPDVSKDAKDERFEKIPDVSKDTKDEGVQKKPDVSKDTKEMAYISKHSTNPVKEEKDKENFSRLCILMMTVCVDLFRDLIDYFIEPEYLKREIDNPKNMPLTLSDQQREIISHLRWPERYPFAMLDLSQLYIVIRYICHIPQPKTGWGFTPEDDDNSLAACMERIRIQKKLLSYLSDTEKVGEFDIKNIWMAIRRNINEIQMLVFEKDTYLRAIDELYSRELTKSETSRYVKSFKHLPSIEFMSGPVTAYIPIQDKINVARLIELVFTIGTELIMNVVSRFLNPEILRDRFELLQYQRKEFPTLILKEAVELHTLYQILTNTIPPHKNGWGHTPESEDNCLAACIERIMIQKDRILKTEESYSYFEDIWKNVRHDMVEIERQVIGGHLHEQVIDDLRYLEINPRWGEKNFIISKNWRLKDLFGLCELYLDRQTIETSKGDDFRSRRIDSPELTEFLNSFMNKIQQNISSLSFAAGLLDKMGIHRLVRELESLKTEVPVILNRESYQRTHGLRPGTVSAYEVDVAYKKGKFEVEKKDAVYHDAFFTSSGDYNPRVILVYSDSIKVVDAKLKVFRKFEVHLTDKFPDKTSIFIHHTYDENDYLSKLSVFFQLSFFCDKIKLMAMQLETSTPQRLVLNEISNIFSKDSKEVVFHECLNVTLKENEADIGTVKSGPHYCNSEANLKRFRQMLEKETIQKACKLLGFLIYRSVKSQRKGDLKEIQIETIPSSTYEKILFEAIKASIPGPFEDFFGKFVSHTESTPIDVNSEEWRNSIAEALCAKVMDKKEEIMKSFVEMHTKTKDELNSMCILLEDLRNSCAPTSVFDLAREWQKREFFKTSSDLKEFSSVLKYTLGRTEQVPYFLKVFFKEQDQKAEAFFKLKGNALSKDTKYDFVNLKMEMKKLWKKQEEIEEKEREANEISLSERHILSNLISKEGKKIFAKYSNVIGIDVSNVLTNHRVLGACEKPCVVLYCLDKSIIPFGESPLPNYIGEYPCDLREDVVTFEACRPGNCPPFSSGCDIGTELWTGSAGFFINSPFQGFLTAAHVPVDDTRDIYKESASNFDMTSGLDIRIVHPSRSVYEVGIVENLIFGNFGNDILFGSDVAIIRNILPTSSSAEESDGQETLMIAEPPVDCLHSTEHEVVKRGKATNERYGFYDHLYQQINLSFKKDPFTFDHMFSNVYVVKDKDDLFAAGGDSGSGVFLIDREDRQLKALGILFARSHFRPWTFVCKIKHIAENFNLTLYKESFANNFRINYDV